jgi:hypothetical protein
MQYTSDDVSVVDFAVFLDALATNTSLETLFFEYHGLPYDHLKAFAAKLPSLALKELTIFDATRTLGWNIFHESMAENTSLLVARFGLAHHSLPG